MQRLYREHGSLATIEDQGQRVIFAFGPEHNRRVLSDVDNFHARFFAIRGPRNSAQRRLTNALLSMNGAEHKRNRRIVMGPFQKTSVEGYRAALATLATELIQPWRVNEVRDMFDDMTHYMLRVASSVLFGFDVPEMAYRIGHLTARWVAMNHELGVGAFLADEQVTASYDHLLEMADTLEREIVAMIEHRRSSDVEGNDVMSLLIRAHDEFGDRLNNDELIGQAAILFGAAHLTTANTLTWTLFLLAQHPEIAEELVHELNTVLHGEPPTVQQIEQLNVLDRVVKESMRVLPASSYSQRITAGPVELGPLCLDRGSIIIFSQFITHHMEELFPEPERFLPERWRTIRPSPYAYLPFAAGPRMCLGGPMAIMIIKMTLAVILQRYRFAVVPGATINGKVTATMLTPTTSVPMIVSDQATPFQATPVRGNIHDLVQLQSMPTPSWPLSRTWPFEFKSSESPEHGFIPPTMSPYLPASHFGATNGSQSGFGDG
ncbi:MAG TPA: cytochrome P450 [Gemmataceae bacterium]|nr:cytochrome P450 [Gemmataceae bacterium]